MLLVTSNSDRAHIAQQCSVATCAIDGRIQKKDKGYILELLGTLSLSDPNAKRLRKGGKKWFEFVQELIPTQAYFSVVFVCIVLNYNVFESSTLYAQHQGRSDLGQRVVQIERKKKQKTLCNRSQATPIGLILHSSVGLLHVLSMVEYEKKTKVINQNYQVPNFHVTLMPYG